LKAILRGAIEKYQAQMETRRLAEAALALNNELLSAHFQSVERTRERNLHLECTAEDLLIYRRLFQTLDVPLILCRSAESVEANPAARRLLAKAGGSVADGSEELLTLPESLKHAVEAFTGESEETELSLPCPMESGEVLSARFYRMRGEFSQVVVAIVLSSCESPLPCPAQMFA